MVIELGTWKINSYTKLFIKASKFQRHHYFKAVKGTNKTLT